jgi:diguanylate cyclase (GGDEF)-like protein
VTLAPLHPPTRETLRVIGLTGCLLSLSLALGTWLHVAAPTPAFGLTLPWWLLAMAFAITESAVLHVQTRREAQTVSISELPLVVGLFFAAPAALLVGRLVGSLAVFVLHRRSSMLKTSFNTALVSTETLVALAVFHLLAGAGSHVEPRHWGAALAAVLTANAVGSVALDLVIGVYEGGVTVRSVLREAVTSQVFAPAVVVLALAAVLCMDSGGANLWVVGAAVVVLTTCYRVYSSLYDRHVNLERLYEFSQAVTHSSENSVVVKRVLDEARELLKSDHARLVIGSSDDRVRSVRITVDEDGALQRTTTGIRTPADWLEDTVLSDGTSVLLPRRGRERRTRMWLGANDLRDAIAVPLRGTDGILGMLLVGERLGEVRTYGREDLLLLETLANHASVALQKGQLIEQLQHDALHDALTGLPNRTSFQRRLGEALQAAARTGDELAVVILDLDGFKDVNDTLGHQQGDLVLTKVAARLTTALGDDGTLARLGGDEFAVFLPRAQREQALAVCRRLATGLQGPMKLQGMQFEVGASVGFAMFPDHGVDGAVLMKRADVAMYEAKTSGLRICEYDPANDTTSARRLALAGQLRSALADDAVEVHVQPQADVRTGEIRSVEALARWRHPDLGVVSPTEFIPVAERSGLIGQLTMAMLDVSLRGAAKWREHGVSVAVNVSPRSLLDPTLVSDVQAALERWQVPPHLLTLEVTEGAVMTDPDRAIALLGRFREMGVRLSVDDFGTGYSSLSYLKRLPVHEVKIDRSFVTALVHSNEDHAIVRSIITLGTNLGLEIVAEGVEDQETYDLLAAMGCTKIQGWHVARPMPVEAATEWLAARRTARPESGQPLAAVG